MYILYSYDGQILGVHGKNPEVIGVFDSINTINELMKNKPSIIPFRINDKEFYFKDEHTTLHQTYGLRWSGLYLRQVVVNVPFE